MSTPGVSTPLVIRPSRGWVPLNLRELWESRELLYFLVWRDIKTRYKQTALGPLWAVVQPVVTMVAFTVVFGWLARMPSDGLPYPVFAFCALLPWQLFARGLGASGASVMGSTSLISKVYFPRLIIPLTAVLGGLVDFAIAFLVLLGMMAFYGIAFSPAVLALPFLILLALVTALGTGLWVAALSVSYRDLRLGMPYLTQLWLFATPVAYPSSVIPEAWRPVFALNPMAGVVEGFRWALVGSPPPPGMMLGVSLAVAGALTLSGLYLFRRMERTFADLL